MPAKKKLTWWEPHRLVVARRRAELAEIDINWKRIIVISVIGGALSIGLSLWIHLSILPTASLWDIVRPILGSLIMALTIVVVVAGQVLCVPSQVVVSKKGICGDGSVICSFQEYLARKGSKRIEKKIIRIVRAVSIDYSEDVPQLAVAYTASHSKHREIQIKRFYISSKVGIEHLEQMLSEYATDSVVVDPSEMPEPTEKPQAKRKDSWRVFGKSDANESRDIA